MTVPWSIRWRLSGLRSLAACLLVTVCFGLVWLGAFTIMVLYTALASPRVWSRLSATRMTRYLDLLYGPGKLLCPRRNAYIAPPGADN